MYEDAYTAFKSLYMERLEVIDVPRYLKASTQLSAWLLKFLGGKSGDADPIQFL